MPNTYEDLFAIGSIRYMKADIVVEAERDLYYVSHIYKEFVEQRGVTDDSEAINCTYKIISDLVDHGYCFLATWSEQKDTVTEVELNQEEIYKVIHNYLDMKANPFDFFLIATEKGHNWVTRYELLIDEL